MKFIRHASRFLFAMTLTTGLAFGQTIDLPSELEEGSKIDVGITGGAANSTVIVEISDDDPINPETITIKVHLDADGKGSATWTVPSWSEATFNADGFGEQSRLIN